MQSAVPLPGKAIKGVYRGYIPPGLPQHRPPNRTKPWLKIYGKPRVDIYPKVNPIEGYSEVAEYPPLNDASLHGRQKEVRTTWYDKIKKIPTIDGKLHEMLKHGNHYIAHTDNWIQHYNALPLVQYLTNTRLINHIPDGYFSTELKPDLIDEVKNIVLNQIAADRYQSNKREPKFTTKTYSGQKSSSHLDDYIVQNIYRGVKKILAIETNPQLLDYQNDLDPAIRSWWYHSGFEPPNNKVFYRSRKDDKGRINQMIQMNGAAALNLRATEFLKPHLSLDDPLVTEKDVIEDYCYPLKNYGFVLKFGNPVGLTGQWYVEDSHFDFPHTTFLTTKCLQLRYVKPYKVVKPLDDHDDCLTSQAILTSFGWTNSLALYHGFTTFHEIEYPFTCQVITTNGQDWLFNVYQLNSHSFHRDLGGPTRNNICWSSGLLQLYKNFDGNNFEGVNDRVIELLMRFMSRQTDSQYTNNLNLRPHLGDDDRTEEVIEEERRVARRAIEQRKNQWLLHDWKVPLWEHIFFRTKVARNSIKEMKPRWHIPKPKYPRIFE